MSYPQQQYPGGGYTPASGGGTNPATAIIAALLALAVAAFQIVFLVKSFGDGLSLGDLPAQVLITYGVTAVGGLLSLLGAMFTFGRKVAGAVLVVIGALVSVAGVFLFPVMFSSAVGGGSIPFGTYLESLFKFGGAEQTVFALTLICGPLAFIFAIIPPTLRHLRGGGADTSYGDPYQQQQPQQQAYPGYNPSPNSGGFPQQDYPGYQQPQQGQGGYPQQPQQGGGYPPQQQGW
ncbi:hypothetical protein ACFQ1S_17530 [Kibdelosporangium lantanae]|uniref:Uncharacterized protein n=1 Tax=Kibdelosporangium lantanae TaxID=1497396 RepID=A0ABW3MC97_9PSEU